MNINRVTLQLIKEFIMFIFFIFFVYFIDVKSSNAFDTRGSLSTRASDVDTERLKKNGTAVKITIETTNNQ